MVVIREVFTAKPGMASKLAAMLKEIAPLVPGGKVRILTDFVGPFNTVVMETETGSLGDFEEMMRQYGARQDIRDRMKGYTELYETGRREIYKVV